MFNMPTSGPLSPTVSLERRKLEQAGAQPGQEQQAAAGMGSPISGDLAQLIQLNRMLQQQGAMQQQANAAPSTVAQDLMQQVTQQRAPQMQPQMPPQMQQMRPPMPPQMDPRQQGIAQLPQEAVGNGMAAGGIVAFDDGGSVRHFAGGGRPYGDDPNMIYDESGIPIGPRALSNSEPEDEYEYGPAEPGLDISGRPKRADTIYDSNGIAMMRKPAIGKKPKPKAPEMTPAQIKDMLANAGDMSRIGNVTVPSIFDRQAPTQMGGASDNVKRAIADTRAAGPSRDEGLAEFVPTLSYSKVSDLERLARDAGIETGRTPEYYGKMRKKMEEESGLAGIWKKQEEEQERLKAEASPEEQKRAFLNNLAARLADQSGQRGVSRSTRIAQMVGAFGGARSSTEEEFKKRRADLNKAANDLQEKQAMYRMTGTAADRADLEKVKAHYEDILKDKETLEQRAQENKATADYRNKSLEQNERMERARLAQQGQIAQENREARVTAASIAAAARAQMSSAQYSAVYNNAKKAVDANDGMGLARAQVAKAANMGKGKAPAPGVDQNFDGMVNKLYKQMVDEQIAASLPGGRMAGVGMGAPVPVDEE